MAIFCYRFDHRDNKLFTLFARSNDAYLIFRVVAIRVSSLWIGGVFEGLTYANSRK